MAVDPNMYDAGMNLWSQRVDALVIDFHNTNQVPPQWRDEVVGLAAAGRQDEAFEQIQQTLRDVGDFYAVGVENGRANDYIRESFEPGIRAWLDRQVQADKAAAGEPAQESVDLSWLNGGTPPLTSAKRLDGETAARPESGSRASGPGRNTPGQAQQSY